MVFFFLYLQSVIFQDIQLYAQPASRDLAGEYE